MNDPFQNVPERIRPYIVLTRRDEPVLLLPRPFRLTGPLEARLDADLQFRWSPSTAVEFEGIYHGQLLGFGDDQWTLASYGDPAFSVPVLITHISPGPTTSLVRGTIKRSFTIGRESFESLRFCLVNFPNYNGSAVQYEHEGQKGLMRGRLETISDGGCCQLDKIPEVEELVKEAERDAGFVTSHVGLWRPTAGVMTAEEAASIAKMLHFWFGMLRGAWAGPLFTQGLNADSEVVWQEFASWRLRESRPVTTWLPQLKGLDLSSAFRGYVQRWNDPVWQDPLITAIHWFVEANSTSTANESRIVLAQVALELLSWVLLVEAKRLYHQNDFEGLSAAGRIRALLHHIGVPTTVPTHLARLQVVCDADAFDGPGAITKVRNALAHSTKKKRKLMESVDGEQRWECSQLALEYLELSLLAVCGHDGYYARRGWRGWKGEDEILVPWRQGP